VVVAVAFTVLCHLVLKRRKARLDHYLLLRTAGEGRDKEAETASEIQGRRCRDKILLGNSANWGLIAGFREISEDSNCVRARSRYRKPGRRHHGLRRDMLLRSCLKTVRMFCRGLNAVGAGLTDIAFEPVSSNRSLRCGETVRQSGRNGLGDSRTPVQRQNLARQLRQFGANRRVPGISVVLLRRKPVCALRQLLLHSNV
jgi:hypothetical protein